MQANRFITKAQASNQERAANDQAARRREEMLQAAQQARVALTRALDRETDRQAAQTVVSNPKTEDTSTFGRSINKPFPSSGAGTTDKAPNNSDLTVSNKNIVAESENNNEETHERYTAENVIGYVNYLRSKADDLNANAMPISMQQEAVIRNMNNEERRNFLQAFEPYSSRVGAFNLAVYKTTGKVLDENVNRLDWEMKHGNPTTDNLSGWTMDSALDFMDQSPEVVQIMHDTTADGSVVLSTTFKSHQNDPDEALVSLKDVTQVGGDSSFTAEIVNNELVLSASDVSAGKATFAYTSQDANGNISTSYVDVEISKESRLTLLLQPLPHSDALISEISTLNTSQISSILDLPERVLTEWLLKNQGSLSGASYLSEESGDLIDALMDAGVSADKVVETFLPNAASISWILHSGAAIDEISTMSSEDLINLTKLNQAGYQIGWPDEAWSLEEDGEFDGVDNFQGILNFAGGAIIFTPERSDDSLQDWGYIVTQQSNPDLYLHLRDKFATAQIDALREQYNLPPFEVIDILGRSTSVYVDESNPDAGYLTVGELAMQKLLDLAGTDQGVGAKIYQLEVALQAQNALQNGYDILPFYEKPGSIHGTTYREYYGGHADPTTQSMTPADLNDMLDAEAVNTMINDLWADPEIAATYENVLNSVIEEYIPDHETLTTSLSDQAKYTELLSDLNELHLDDEAAVMMSKDIAALTVLDPEIAVSLTENLLIDGAKDSFLRIMDDPSLVDEETFEVAFMDSVVLGLSAARNGVNGMLTFPSQAILASEKISPETISRLSDVVRRATMWVRTVGGDASLVDAVNRELGFIPASQRGALQSTINKLQSYGVWGSVASAAAYASFAYKLSEGAWTKDSTPMERWGAARDFITALSYSNNVGLSVSSAWDKFLRPNEAGVAKVAFGLDRTLPQIWGKDTAGWVSEDIRKSFGNFFSAYDDATVASIGDRTITPPAGLSAADLKTGNLAIRVGQSIQKFFAFGFHFVGGIADIVTGAIGVTQAARNGDKGMVAVGSLQIAAGAGLASAGAILASQLPTAVAPWWAAAVWPMATAAAVLGVAASAAGFIVNRVRTAKFHNNLQEVTNQQSEWFAALDELDLTKQNFYEKLDYIRTAYAVYGNDNIDSTKSYFDVQQSEFQHFIDTPQEGGSFLNRLDADLHVDSEKTSDKYHSILHDTTAPDLSESGIGFH